MVSLITEYHALSLISPSSFRFFSLFSCQQSNELRPHAQNVYLLVSIHNHIPQKPSQDKSCCGRIWFSINTSLSLHYEAPLETEYVTLRFSYILSHVFFFFYLYTCQDLSLWGFYLTRTINCVRAFYKNRTRPLSAFHSSRVSIQKCQVMRNSANCQAEVWRQGERESGRGRGLQ